MKNLCVGWAKELSQQKRCFLIFRLKCQLLAVKQQHNRWQKQAKRCYTSVHFLYFCRFAFIYKCLIKKHKSYVLWGLAEPQIVPWIQMVPQLSSVVHFLLTSPWTDFYASQKTRKMFKKRKKLKKKKQMNKNCLHKHARWQIMI